MSHWNFDHREIDGNTDYSPAIVSWNNIILYRVLVVVMRHFKLCYQLILWPWYFILLVKICVTIHYTTLKHRNYPTTW